MKNNNNGPGDMDSLRDLTNIRALRSKDVTPAIVLCSLDKALPTIKQMYVVTLTDDGPVLYATGDLSDLCYAAKVLDDLATRFVRNEIEEER